MALLDIVYLGALKHTGSGKYLLKRGRFYRPIFNFYGLCHLKVNLFDND